MPDPDNEADLRKLVGLVVNFGADWERRRNETKWPPSSAGMTTAAMLLR